MAEEASLNVNQDTKSEAELLAAQFDALDDEFSDGELSMLIDEPFVTPTVETSLKVEPMEPQFEPLQNSIPSASIGLVKKIKFSSKTRPSQGVPVTPAAAKREIYKINPGEVAADDFESLNRLYYMYLFPYKSFFHWLNYGTEVGRNFTHREFSFTIDEIYMRYQSFDSELAFKDRLKRLCPGKIDIGAVYDFEPRKKASLGNPLVPQSRELVFDIDLTDYDDVRTCCEKTTICQKCWGYMRLAMKVVHTALTEDFGFRHILWVFSGGRGIHAWVCDERARMLSNEGRKGIASYLDIRRPGGPRRVAFGQTLHPSIQRVWAMVEETYNDTVLAQQDLLNSEKADAILESLPEELRAEVRNKWSDTANYASSQKRWEQLVTAVGKYRNSPKGKKTNLLETFVRDMILQCCFPRLDVHVTTAMNHLLKAPFCIHPRSRKICVPIATTEFDTFDPDKVPTDFLVLSELANNSGLGGSYTAERTSLWPYIQTFDSFVDTLLADQPSRLNVFLEF